MSRQNALPAMPIDPELQKFMAQALEKGLDVEIETPSYDQIDVADHVVRRESEGLEVPVRTFRSRTHAAEAGPGFFYIHGGGFFRGDLTTGISEPLNWVRAVGGTMASVEYRLAPSDGPQALVEDCLAGWLWMVDHAGQLGIDPTRIVLVGDSAGGALAACLTLLLRDRGLPTPLGLLMTSPAMDNRGITPSTQQNASVGIWTPEIYTQQWEVLLGDVSKTDDVPPYTVPTRHQDFSGLPTTYVDAGAAEYVRDEVIEYAGKLMVEGVSVDLHIWSGAYHGFGLFVPDAAVSRTARQTRLDWVSRVVGAPGGA